MLEFLTSLFPIIPTPALFSYNYRTSLEQKHSCSRRLLKVSRGFFEIQDTFIFLNHARLRQIRICFLQISPACCYPNGTFCDRGCLGMKVITHTWTLDIANKAQVDSFPCHNSHVTKQAFECSNTPQGVTSLSPSRLF